MTLNELIMKNAAEVDAALPKYFETPELYTISCNGKKLAGLTGNAFGNWFFIDFLFVDEALRGQGMGKKIIALAEDEAVRQGCKYAFVSTNAFQAPEFYIKQGYKVAFTIKEFPVNGQRFYYTKEL